MAHRRKKGSKVVFASRITYYLRRIKNVAFFENGPQNAWLDPKKRQKTSKNSVFRGLEPLRGPEKRCFLGSRRGSSPLFGVFLGQKQGWNPSENVFFRLFCVFWGFLGRFWPLFSCFLRVFEPFLGRLERVQKPSFWAFLGRFWGFWVF